MLLNITPIWHDRCIRAKIEVLQIDVEAFNNLISLKVLNLSDTSIATVDHSTFAPLKSLEVKIKYQD